MWLSSPLRLFDFVWFFMENALSHAYTSQSVSKSEVQSRSASGTSPLKLIAKTLRYQDASVAA